VSLLELGGVNGSFDVSIQEVEQNRDEIDVDGTCPLAAKVHVDSLSPGQANILTSDVGDVELSFDRKIETDLRLLSSPFVSDIHPNLLLEEDEDCILQSLEMHEQKIGMLLDHVYPHEQKSTQLKQEQPVRIQVETEAFSRSDTMTFDGFEYIQGVIENKSREPNSRFDVKTKGLVPSVGKINTQGAAGQALKGFTGGGENNQIFNDISTKKLSDLPLVAVSARGQIKVESLSWIGAIARRYGIKNEERDVRRQAKSGRFPNT
jgi:hypothetical protein